MIYISISAIYPRCAAHNNPQARGETAQIKKQFHGRLIDWKEALNEN